MFDLLKKKVAGFINRLTGKEEEKAAEKTAEVEKPVLEAAEPLGVQKPTPAAGQPEATDRTVEKKEEPPVKKPKGETLEKKPAAAEKGGASPQTAKPKPIREEPKPGPVVVKPPALSPPVEKPETPAYRAEEKPATRTAAMVEPKAVDYATARPPPREQKTRPAHRAEEEQRPRREVKLGILSSIKSMVTGEVEIRETEVQPLLEEFELELLESDVAMEVAEDITQQLHGRLVGAKVKRGQVGPHIQNTVRQTLVELMENPQQFDLLARVRESERPVKIMFLGPNGAGKTTTMGKMAHLLQKNGHTVVFSASDTFRAAAIEQLGIHAERLGVPIIRHRYGSDPTAVAFDAVDYAKKHHIDVVLIDTAGRQDTNANLLNELRKMQRIIRPDIKLYIGEALAGQALLEQVTAFHHAIGVDGVVLTKLDCDPKGGTVLSVSKATGIPVLYVGMGQRYEDLEAFDAERMVQRILA